ncbi:MAG TPA: response regulator [Spirillospora sp.]|nr:response regulator [Spirillospora sp.]
MKIMVLDDNPEILSMVTTMLETFYSEAQIIAGRNGAEGLALLNSADTSPDVILTNLRMPTMDGMAFMSEVRHNTTWDNIRLVMMSAITSAEVETEAAAKGAQAFLRKPFTSADLRAALNQVLGI